MLKLLKYILWVVVLLALTTGFDQIMVNIPLTTAGLKQTQTFYLDFRLRLLNLVGIEMPTEEDMIKQVIEKSGTTESASTPKVSRYLYVDDQGALQFADSLQQVPVKYRPQAQPLAE